MGELEELRASAEMGVKARGLAARLSVENKALRAQLAAAEKAKEEAEAMNAVLHEDRETMRAMLRKREELWEKDAKNPEQGHTELSARYILGRAQECHFLAECHLIDARNQLPRAQAVAEVLDAVRAWADSPAGTQRTSPEGFELIAALAKLDSSRRNESKADASQGGKVEP